MRVLVLGASGQLGSDILRRWRDPSLELVPATRADADVTDREAVDALLACVRPDVTINTAAFHNLPACEQDPERCFRVNVAGGLHVARAARAAGSAIVQFSTDYVFDGTKGAPYLETDARRALNVYGASKLATEDVVAQANPDWAVVRVSGLYGLAGSAGKGGNFVETMLRLAREARPIRVVADQVLSPTYTADLATAIARLLAADPPGGVYHLTNAGACSWFEFAREIFGLSGLAPDLAPTTSEAFGAPARRPPNSVLLNARAHALGVPPLRPWPDALRAYLAARAPA